jgi:hypothetical protein
VIVAVTVSVVIVVVTIGLHLYFRVDRMGQGKGFVASFWLEPENHRELELPSGWSLRIKGL